MGKNGGSSSWLSAVKNAFRSPIRDTNGDQIRYKIDDLEGHEQEKKRGKRRRSLTINSKEHTTIRSKTNNNNINNVGDRSYEEEKRDAIEMAMATAAAAKAAVATAQAAVEFMRKNMVPRVLSSEHQAAVVIQKMFRGYLARRALSALRGLVKLQALIRGYNVRKRTKMTFQRLRALIRVQAQLCDQRRRLSISNDQDSFSPGCFSEKILTTKDGDGDDNENVAKEVDTISILKADERAWKCERDLAYAFSNKIWRSDMEEHSDLELSEWNEKWNESNQWKRQGRYSFDQITPIKIVSPSSNNVKLNKRNSYEQNTFSIYSECSSLNNKIPSYKSIIKSCQIGLKHLHVRSANPRSSREDELICMKSQTPSSGGFLKSNTNMPSYMAETASTKARVRPQSAPRQQRSSISEREGVGIPKRCLSFTAMDEEPSPSSINLMRKPR